MTPDHSATGSVEVDPAYTNLNRRAKSTRASKLKKDRGTYAVAPLTEGGFLDNDGQPVAAMSHTFQRSAGVYKSQTGLDKHVLSEKHRVHLERTSSEQRTHRTLVSRLHLSVDAALFRKPDAHSASTPLPVDSEAGSLRKNWRPAIVAGVSLFILTVVATILMTVLLGSIREFDFNFSSFSPTSGPFEFLSKVRP